MAISKSLISALFLLAISQMAWAGISGTIQLKDRYYSIDKKLYMTTADTIGIVVTDPDLNTNPSTVQQLYINVKSDVETSGENLLLTESGVNSSIFMAYIPVQNNKTPAGDGMLQAWTGNRMIATYNDVVNEYGSNVNVMDSAVFVNTVLSGSQSGNLTLIKTNSPYVISGNYTIPAGDTLFLQSGVQLLMFQRNRILMYQYGDSIRVYGALLSQGTAADSVVLSVLDTVAPQPADWFGLYVSGGSVTLRHTKLQFAHRALHFHYDYFSGTTQSLVRHCRFSQNDTALYYYNYNSSLIQLTVDSSIFEASHPYRSDYGGLAFYYSMFESSNDSVLIADNLIQYSRRGYYNQSGIEVSGRHNNASAKKMAIRHNVLLGDSSAGYNASGIALRNTDSIKVVSNTISGFNYGLYLYNDVSAADSNTVQNCRINVNNQIDDQLLFATTTLHYNTFGPAYERVIQSYQSYSNELDLDARFNYWGAAMTSEITSSINPKNLSGIYDKWDAPSAGMGYINYSRYLDSQNGTPAPGGNNGWLKLTDVDGYDDSTFLNGETVYLEVTDRDLNNNPSVAQTITITVKSGVESIGETITLTEAGIDTPLFKGSIATEKNNTANLGDHILQIWPGESITASYTDAMNAYGSSIPITRAAQFADNYTSGDIETNTTWDLAGSPYLVNGQIRVAVGITLTIDPGVVVRFVPSPQPGEIPSETLTVFGTLIANGTSTDSIIFTSNAPTQKTGDWYGILVNGGQVTMKYCRVTYAEKGVDFSYQNIVGASQNSLIRHCNLLNGFTGINYDLNNSSADIRLMVDSSLFKSIENADTAFRGGITFSYNSDGQIGDTITIADNTIDFVTGKGNHYRQGIQISGRCGLDLIRGARIAHNTITVDSTGNWQARGLSLANIKNLTVVNNTLSGFRTGIFFQNDTSVLCSNTVQNCGRNVEAGFVFVKPMTTFNFNNLGTAWEYVFLNSNDSAVNARYNYWGSAMTTEINGSANPKNLSGISDKWDDNYKGRVDYSGWLNSAGGTPAPTGYSGSMQLLDHYWTDKTLFQGETDTLWLQVNDMDLNTSNASVQNVNITVKSGVEISGETVTLTETDTASGIFRGYIVPQNSASASPGDGKLQIQSGQNIIAAYNEAANAYGTASVLGDTAIFAMNTVSGTINVNTTWTKAGGPYLLSGTVRVLDSVTLTIDAGAQILFMPRNRSDSYDYPDTLIVQGSLVANGIVSDSIIFTSNSADPKMTDWYGLYINGGQASLKYCRVSYAVEGVALNYDYVNNTLNNVIRHCNLLQNQSGVHQYLSNSSGMNLTLDSSRISVSATDTAVYQGIYLNYYPWGTLDDSLCVKDNVIDMKNTKRLISHQGIKITGRSGASLTKKGWILRNTVRADSASGMEAVGLGLQQTDSLKVFRNDISGFTPGIKLENDTSEVCTNYVHRCEIGIRPNTSGVKTLFRGNSLSAMKTFQFFNTTYDNLDAQYNYWGVTTTAQINTGSNPKNLAAIFDHWDNSDYGTVNYANWLTTTEFNMPPEITSKAPDTIKQNFAYQYQVVATDPNGTSPVYNLKQKPSGMTINTGTGLVQWTASVVGQHTIIVGATDNVTDTFFQTFSLNVIADSVPPTNIYTLTATASTDSIINLSWTKGAGNNSADAESLGIWYKVGSYPTGATDVGAVKVHTGRMFDSTLSVKNLQPKTNYYFCLMVKDTTGNWSTIADSAKRTAKTLDLTKPVNPMTLTAVALDETRIQLKWNLGTLAGSDVDSTRLWGSVIQSPDSANWQGPVIYSIKHNRTDSCDTVIGLAAKTKYYFALYVRDSSANWSDTTAASRKSATTLDQTAPANVTGLAANYLGGGKLELSWTPSISTDKDSVMIRYNQSVSVYPASPTDKTLWAVWPASRTKDTLIGLIEKTPYTFGLFVRDSSGNYSAANAAARSLLTIPDQTPPAPVTALSANYLGNGKVELSWVTSIATDKDSVMVRYLPNSAIAPTSTSDGTMAVMKPTSFVKDTVSGLLEKNSSGFTVFIRDSSANYSAAASVVLSIPDKTPPVNNLTLTATAVSHNDILLTWNPSILAGTDVDSVRILYSPAQYPDSSAGSGFLVGNYPLSITTIHATGLAYLTPYYFSITLRDSSGNRSDTCHTGKATATTPNPPPPNVTELTATALDSTTLSIHWDKPALYVDSVLLCMDTLRFLSDISKRAQCVRAQLFQPADTFWTLGGLKSGTVYYISAFTFDQNVVNDTLNNNAQFSVVTPSFTPIAPVITTSLTRDTAYSDAAYTRDIDALDANGDVVNFTLLTGPRGMALAAATGIISFTPLATQVGDTVVAVIASDGILKDTLTFTLRILSSNLPPSFVTRTTDLPDTVIERTTWNFTLQATDPDLSNGDQIRYFLQSATLDSMKVDSLTGEIVWKLDSTMTGQTGTFSFLVRDSAGLKDTLHKTITVKDVNDAPVIQTVLIRDTINEDMAYLRTLEATDRDRNDLLSWTLLHAPTGMAINGTGTLSWSPKNENVGDTVVEARVADAAGAADTLRFILTVRNVNDAPVMTTVLDKDSATEKSLYAKSITASDVDMGDILSWQLLKAPAGMTLSTASGTTNQLRFTPTNAQVGDTIVSVRVQDQAGASDTLLFSLKIINVNDAPVITTTTQSAVLNEDSPYALTLSASDIDKGDSLRYVKLRGPSRATLTDSILRWTPSNAEVNQFRKPDTVVIRVLDKAGASDTFTISLRVNNVNDTPTVSIVEEPLVNYGAIKIKFTVNDSDRIHTLDSTLNWKGTLFSTSMGAFLYSDSGTAKANIVSLEFYPVYDDSVILSVTVRDAASNSLIARNFTVGKTSGQSLITRTVPAKQWEMISLPSKGTAIPTSFNDSTRWIRSWNEDLDSYDGLAEGLSTFQRGKAYWVMTDAAFSINVGSSSRLTNICGPCTLSVLPGWNMVASPYAYAVQWIGIDTLHTWADTGYAKAGILEPWKGYFYHSLTASRLIFNGTPYNPDSVQKSAAKLAKSPFFTSETKWHLGLSCGSISGRDGLNILGIHPQAKNGVDNLDQFEPPLSPVGKGVTLHFMDGNNALSRSLLKPASGTYEWWVALNGTGDATINLSGLAELPDRFHVYLGREDRYTDLRAAKGSFAAKVAGESYYSLVVTDDPDFLKKQILSYDLAQNRPNPFNPATSIRYTVPRLFSASGKPIFTPVHVNLKLYDLRGRLVRTLVDNKQPRGKQFTVLFDGKDDYGRLLASGIYVYRVDMEGRYVKSRKMTLVK